MAGRVRHGIIGALIVLTIALQACGGGSTSQTGQRKTLIYAGALQDRTFDPAFMNTGELVYGDQVYQSLIRFDPNNPTNHNTIVPMLAQTWDVNSDASVYTYHLFHNIKFSNGDPLTSADVKFSLDRLWHIQSPLSNVMQGYKEITTPDPYTVVITMQHPDASFLVKMTGPQTGVFDSKVAQQHGAVSDASAITADKAKAWFDMPLTNSGVSSGDYTIGSGPFIIDSAVPNDHVTLKRNTHYWGKAPALDKVIVQIVPDVTTQRQLLERGTIDIATDLDFATASQMESEKGVNIQYAKGNTNLTILFMTNSATLSKPLSDKVVRQAVELAIDYNGILALANGHAQRPPTSIPVGLFGCCGIPVIQQDINKSKQLLAQEGYPNGFTVTFAYGQGLSGGVDTALIATKVQSDLAKVGITLNLQPYGGSSFLPAYRAAILSMGLSGIGGVSDPDAFVGDIWVSTHNFVTKRLHFQDPAIDALYPQSLATTGDARQQVYNQLQMIFQQDAAVQGLMQADAILASTSKVHGYRFLPENVATDFSSITVDL